MTLRKPRAYPATTHRIVEAAPKTTRHKDEVVSDVLLRPGSDVVLDMGDNEAICRVASTVKTKCPCGGTQYHLEQVQEDSSWLYIGQSCIEHLTRVH